MQYIIIAYFLRFVNRFREFFPAEKRNNKIRISSPHTYTADLCMEQNKQKITDNIDKLAFMRYNIAGSDQHRHRDERNIWQYPTDDTARYAHRDV